MPRIDPTKTNLTNVDLTQHTMGKSAYKGADFSFMYCVKVNFTGLDLTGANFTGAEVTGALFTDATLDGANFTDAFIRVPGEKEEKYPLMHLEQLSAAKSLKGTILGDGTLADAPAKEPVPDMHAQLEALKRQLAEALAAKAAPVTVEEIKEPTPEPQKARRT